MPDKIIKYLKFLCYVADNSLDRTSKLNWEIWDQQHGILRYKKDEYGSASNHIIVPVNMLLMFVKYNVADKSFATLVAGFPENCIL